MSRSRERLKEIIDEVAEAAKRKVDNPRNVAKGQAWDKLFYDEYVVLIQDEINELYLSGASPDESRERYDEAGDALAFIAMIVDTLESRWQSKEGQLDS